MTIREEILRAAYAQTDIELDAAEALIRRHRSPRKLSKNEADLLVKALIALHDAIIDERIESVINSAQYHEAEHDNPRRERHAAARISNRSKDRS